MDGRFIRTLARTVITAAAHIIPSIIGVTTKPPARRTPRQRPQPPPEARRPSQPARRLARKRRGVRRRPKSVASWEGRRPSGGSLARFRGVEYDRLPLSPRAAIQRGTK